MSTSNITSDVETAYKNFILEAKHPCIMAKTLFMTDNYHLKTYDSITDVESLKLLLNDIASFLDQYDFESNEFESLLAVFPNNHFETEIDFEKALWKALQRLHDMDDSEWDTTVSKNPEDSNFSFSLKGKAFYIVGLHPNSSRIARQSPYTTIVFNLHWQFEKLREMGTYKKVKKRIRKRDKKLQGHINPMLKDFRKDSEVKQYSGRNLDNQWKCPFHSKS
ncbi:guanitoxin biosynthesis heme-dependent pre-guanitoxin N-hydroxylase GntA [Winogradskyella bathintestinalis]|uniref:Guanitoxin biosynthesis heme-dependent pre-guanitoxin N-hydroxylase GntA n=1 Tax=Winogradskyella bathintestinalis TaxID=3035208 RepID=A0ABT7ZUT0_9FLAO|nr:guanitoxin biosynthesis heme-dependent pre-guanitoxin N-hydroxylase GntA [Winogradskyella bathintestinalis]MDN3492564.1 guanitoxin biosynthesis heme-dependent pre-guanitoxin N-hydroxylase GntA [Winogradskyella bathintestinalis]